MTLPDREGRSFSVKVGAGGNTALLRPTMVPIVRKRETLEMNVNLGRCFNLGQ